MFSGSALPAAAPAATAMPEPTSRSASLRVFLRSVAVLLKHQLKRSLHHAWISCGRDLAECTVGPGGVGIVELRVVQEVEELGAELQADVLRDREDLLCREIVIERAW